MTLMNIIRNLFLPFRCAFLLPHFMLYRYSGKKEIIDDDIKSFLKSPKRKILFGDYLLAMSDKYFRTIINYRLGRLAKIFTCCCSRDCTFIIDSNSIMGGVRGVHPFATIIHAKHIGKNFTFRQCTTVGNKYDGRNDLLPCIGDNVTLGANVVIIGDVNIGNNVIVGAGSVVVKDIPDNVVVAGNPAKVIKTITE